jgi:hypothetical protein
MKDAEFFHGWPGCELVAKLKRFAAINRVDSQSAALRRVTNAKTVISIHVSSDDDVLNESQHVGRTGRIGRSSHPLPNSMFSDPYVPPWSGMDDSSMRAFMAQRVLKSRKR